VLIAVAGALVAVVAAVAGAFVPGLLSLLVWGEGAHPKRERLAMTAIGNRGFIIIVYLAAKSLRVGSFDKLSAEVKSR